MSVCYHRTQRIVSSLWTSQSISQQKTTSRDDLTSGTQNKCWSNYKAGHRWSRISRLATNQRWLASSKGNRSSVAGGHGKLHQWQPTVHCEWVQTFRNYPSSQWTRGDLKNQRMSRKLILIATVMSQKVNRLIKNRLWTSSKLFSLMYILITFLAKTWGVISR